MANKRIINLPVAKSSVAGDYMVLDGASTRAAPVENMLMGSAAKLTTAKVIKHVYIGDSRTIGSVGTAWPSKMVDHMPEYAYADVHNLAVGGQPLATAYANYSAPGGASSLKPAPGEIAYLHIEIAGQLNDYVVNGTLAAASFATYKLLYQAGIDDGYIVICGLEPLSGALDATGLTQRTNFNNSLLQWHPCPEMLARFDLLAIDVTDTGDFFDAPTGSHFTADFASRCAGESCRVIPGNAPLIMGTGRNSRVMGRLGIGLKTDPTYTLDIAGNVAADGYAAIAIKDLASGGKQFIINARRGLAGTFGVYNQTDGTVRFDSTETTFELPTVNLLIGTSATTGTSTATPKCIDLGDTYNSTPGAVAGSKVKVYHSTSNSMGLGPSTTGIDFMGTAIAYTFYNAGVNIGQIGATGAMTLGTAGSNVGSVALFNATSGNIKIQPAAGALGSAVLTAPAQTATLVTDADVGLSTPGWTAYTPTVTAGTGTFTTTVATGFHKTVGKTVHVRIRITVTTVGTAAGSVIATLPSTAQTPDQLIPGYEVAVTGKMMNGYILGSGNTVSGKFYDNTFSSANGHVYLFQGTYEKT